MSLTKRLKNWPLFITPDGATLCSYTSCNNPYFLKEFKSLGDVNFDFFKIALIQHIKKYHS